MSDLPSAELPVSAADLRAMAAAVTPVTAVRQRVDCSQSDWFVRACHEATETLASSGRPQMAAALHVDPDASPALRLQALLRLVRLEVSGERLAPWGPSWFPLGSPNLDRVSPALASADSAAEILWHTEDMLEGVHMQAPVVLGEQILSATYRGIEVVSTRDGEYLGRAEWAGDSAKDVSGPAIVYNGCYIQGRQDDKLYAYNCGSGLPRLRWTADTYGSARAMSALAAADSVVVMFLVKDRIPFLSAYDLSSGVNLWGIELPGRYHANDGQVAPPLIMDETVCVAFGGMVQLRQLKTGRLIWQRRFLAPNRLGPERNLISALARRGDRLYVVTDDAALLELAADNGELLLECPSPFGPLCAGVTFLDGSPVVLCQEAGNPLALRNGALTSIGMGAAERCSQPPWVVGQRLVWLTRLGRLHSIGHSVGRGWSVALPKKFATPRMAVVDGTFYFLSGTGHLCAARSPS